MLSVEALSEHSVEQPVPLATPQHELDAELVHRASRELQTSLELSTLLEIFSGLLRSPIPHTGLDYYSHVLPQVLQVGRSGRYALERVLLLAEEQTPLGIVRLTRETPFDAREQRLFAQCCELLGYPLRNALLYHQALAIAATDPLTGANNRSVFQDMVEREIHLSRRHRTPLSMICADIDHFKQVNDRHGHAAGDAVIMQVAAIMRQCIRASDVLFRYGGEEFVVLLTNTAREGARQLAERIRKHTANRPCHYGHKRIAVTLSLGVHTLTPDDDPDSLFQQTDQAMYAAKHAGRNRVCLSQTLVDSATK